LLIVIRRWLMVDSPFEGGKGDVFRVVSSFRFQVLKKLITLVNGCGLRENTKLEISNG